MQLSMSNNATDNGAAQNKTASTAHAWLVCVIAGLFFFYEFMQMNMFNALNQPLRDAFHLNAPQITAIGNYYFYANMLFLFPAGILLDRVSTKKLILISMILCVSGTFFISISSSITMIKVCRFLTGIGGSFCLLSCLRLASRWFPADHMALASGVIVTIGMLGGLFAQTPLTLMIEHLGWRHALQLDSSMGFIIILAIILIVKDYPPREKQHYAEDHVLLHNLGFWHSIFKALGNPQNWIAGLYTCLLNAPLAILGAIWGITFLHNAHGLSRESAALATSMLFLGTLVGSPIVGGLSDHMKRRRLPMLIGALVSVVLVLIFVYAQHLSPNTWMALFFLTGFITSVQILGYPLISESNPSCLTGTSLSIASFLILGGYAVLDSVFAWLMQLHWQGQVVNGTPHYLPQDFATPMWLLPAVVIIALVAACLIKETYCQALSTDIDTRENDDSKS